MKTTNKRNVGTMLMSIGLGLLSFNGMAQEHLTLSLENITTTANTIEYDLFVVNDGSTAIKLTAYAYGVGYNGTILNGGMPSNESFMMIPGTRSQALQGLTPPSIAVVNRDHVNQLRLTTIPVRIHQAAPLASNVPYKVGRFKFTNNAPWTPNSNPSFSLNEFNVPGISTTLATGYVDGSTSPTGFSTAKKNLTVKVVNSPVLNPTRANDVIATMNGATSIASDEITNADIAIKGLNNGSTSSTIMMYPNPTQDILNIDMNTNQSAQTLVKVTDVRGRIVKQIQAKTDKGLNNLTISLRELPSGVYTIQVFEDNVMSQTQQITKND
jgi:hypothetical protein